MLEGKILNTLLGFEEKINNNGRPATPKSKPLSDLSIEKWKKEHPTLVIENNKLFCSLCQEAKVDLKVLIFYIPADHMLLTTFLLKLIVKVLTLLLQ